MRCRICDHEKHSGHFGMNRRRVGYRHPIGRLPICDECQIRVVEEPASDIAEDIMNIHEESDKHQRTLPRR